MRKWLYGVFVVVIMGCAGVASANAPTGQQGPPPQYDQGEPDDLKDPKDQRDQGEPPPHGGTQYNNGPNNAPPPPVQKQRVKRHLNYANQYRSILSLSVIFFGNGDAYPVTQSMGVVAGLKILQPLELEVGASFFDGSSSFFGNAGASWAIAKTRNFQGAGLELRGGFLTGYRFMRIDDEFGLDLFHGITTSATLEFNIWFSRHLGLHFHVAGGLGFWVARTDNRMPIAFPEFRSSVGVIF